ncbi:MAG: MazG family protein [Clostridia bacterium]|nr:MazG family protein [Clostridia bacterium]
MSKESLKNKENYTFDDLVELLEILCAPDGCPWDSVQTHASIRNNFIEETYEAVEGIDNNDPAIMQEELGDVLLQVMLHCEIARKVGTFTKEDVLNELCRKLIFRHPHLFAENYEAESPDQAIANWEALKKKEKGFGTGAQVVSSVSAALPALMRAQKLNTKAIKNGIIDTFAAPEEVSAKAAALEKSVKSGSKEEQSRALGRLLFAVCSLAGSLDINAEQALFVQNAEFCDNICADC